MYLTPLGTRILCSRLPAADRSPGGIALIDRNPTAQARVLKVGPKVEGIRPGNIIVFETSQYEVTTFEGSEVLFVDYNNVHAVLGD